MSGVGGGSGGVGGGAGGAGDDVAQELANVKAKIEKLETAIEEHGTGDGDCRIKLLAGLREKENRLAEQQQQREQAAHRGGDTKRRKLEPIRELAEDDPVVRFWKALCEVKEEVGDSGAEVLQLPDGVFWGGDEELWSALVVRQCYKDLFRIITLSRRKRFVVTGTPGIGKSFFALYWLWRVAKTEGGSAIYETGDKVCKLFSAGVEMASRGDAMSAGWFDDDWRFYLVDLMEKAMPYHQFRGKTIVFCSPDPSRFKEFIKGVGKKLYMPVWSDEEMRRLRLECFEEVDTSVAAEQARMYGNIPRFVLQMAADGDEELENAISKRGGDLSSLFRAAGDDAGDDTKLSYKLLHMIVDRDSRYTKQHLGWASQHVLARLLQEHEQTILRDLKEFVAYGNVEGAYGSLRGHLFEGFAHRALATGRVVTPRRLDRSSTDAEAAGLRRLLGANREQEVFSHLVGEELALDKLLMPKARNLESLDSLLISSGGDVVLFSVTVSKAHGAKVRGLREAVQAAAQALTVAVRRKILLFVVPEDLVPAFGKQKYGAQGGAEWKAAWPQELAGLEQWVVGIKLA